MNDPDDGATREDAVYAWLLGLLNRYGFVIALAAPPVLLSLVVEGEGIVLLVALIWLGEAMVYAAIRRRRSGVRSGPGPALQGLWVVLASLFIIGGLFGFAASGAPAALGAIALGVVIVAWVWSRVARSSGEDSRVFLARIARTLVGTAATAVGILAISAVVTAVGLPGLVVVLVTFLSLVTLLFWAITRTLR